MHSSSWLTACDRHHLGVHHPPHPTPPTRLPAYRGAPAGEFVLTHPEVRIPEKGKIYSINEGNSRNWDPAITKWVSDWVYWVGFSLGINNLI